MISLGHRGEHAQEIAGKLFGGLRNFVWIPATPARLRNKIGDTRFQIDASAEQAVTLWQMLSQHAQNLSAASAGTGSTSIRHPVILPQTQEQFVPQMMNLDLIVRSV